MTARPTTSPATVTVNSFNTHGRYEKLSPWKTPPFSSITFNASQRPKLIINYTTGGTPSNPAPSITSFSPGNLTPSYAVNSTTSFNVTTDQQVSSIWYLNGIQPE